MAKKIKLRISPRLLRKRAHRTALGGRNHCRFKSNPEAAAGIDYKNVNLLRNFLTERGKILPSRISGVSAPYQRKLTREIKKARTMALLPFAANH